MRWREVKLVKILYGPTQSRFSPCCIVEEAILFILLRICALQSLAYVFSSYELLTTFVDKIFVKTNLFILSEPLPVSLLFEDASC